MTASSRIPGFHALALDERRRLVAAYSDCEIDELNRVLDGGGCDSDAADKTVENVIGTYSLPFCVGTNTRINGRDYLVPMAIEEPSVVAAASNASKIVRANGGFHAESDEPLMVAQIQLWDVADSRAASADIESDAPRLCLEADRLVPGLVARGGGARRIEVRDLGEGLVVVHVVIDVRDAMGANLVNTVAEGLAPRIAKLAGGTVGLRILSNLTDLRCVRVEAKISTASLAHQSMPGERVRDGIVAASRFAENDPYRAATHNKGIMNGVDAVAIATGNDWRAIEAGAHAFAARKGTYGPLATWHCGDDGSLVGRIEMPSAFGIVGGTLRIHAGARLALKILGVQTAQGLAMVAASVGLASNLAALRALVTDGIQRGHMALHARSVASAVGGQGHEIELIAAEIAESASVTVEAARRALSKIRASRDQSVEHSEPIG